MNKKNNIILIVLVIAFFISGASALIYQILWVKELTLTFGSATPAVSAILTSFMGGLALGSYLMSRLAYKIKKVILSYAILEVCIGIYALIIPNIFQLTDFLYRYLWPITEGNEYFVILIRFILAVCVLIIPTSFMGATLPLLVKFYVDKDDVIVKYTSILYGINTFGAVFGAFLCGFYLLETFGMRNTNYIAVSVSLTASLIAYILSLNTEKDKTIINLSADNKSVEVVKYTIEEKFLLAAMLISGATAMVYEIIWARELVLIFGSTNYAYTSMLGIFLIGITIGSLCINNWFKDNNKNIYYFGLLEILIGILVIAGAYYYCLLFYIFVNLSMFLGMIIPIIIISTLLILPVSIIFGMLFPLSIKLFVKSYESISERTGKIYSFNTAGCILGSISTAFILIPFMGLEWSLIFSACLNVLIGGGYLILTIKKPLYKYISLACSCLLLIIFVIYPPDWESKITAVGISTNKSTYATVVANLSFDNFFKTLDKQKIVFYKEGYHSTVAVSEFVQDNKKNYSLHNNGKVDASTTLMDMRTQTIIGYLPQFIKENIGDALIVGMGSGMSAGVLEKSNAESIELVELEPAIVEASKFFNERYGDPLKDKRLKLIIDDARNYLRVINKKYDVIISEPSNVWVSGVANLFTQDYYNIIKNKLKPDGILIQWIQLYNLRPQAVTSVLMALKAEFKYVYIFHSRTGGDFIFVASQKPVKLDLKLIKKKLNDIDISKDFASLYNILNEYEFFNLYISDNNSLEKYLKPLKRIVYPNTDDNAFLEFTSTKDYLYGVPEDKVVKTFSKMLQLKGVNLDDVINPPDNFFEDIILGLSSMYNRTQNPSLERRYPDMPSEIPLMLVQLQIYALKYFQQYPDSPTSYYYVGTTNLDNGHLKEGIEALHEAVKRNSKEPKVYILLSQYYNRLLSPEAANFDSKKTNEYIQKAYEYAQKAENLNKNDPYTHLLKGISKYNSGDYSTSVKELTIYYNKMNKLQAPLDKIFFDLYAKSSLKFRS